MTYSAKSDRSLQRAISRFANSSEEMAMKGSYHPDAWDAVEKNFDRAKYCLERLVERRVKDGGLLDTCQAIKDEGLLK